ncbi:hypothetical protein CQ014_04090 [Pseudomonas lurida]|nr:hypothetical protein CLM75_06230 [Pseudomonas lurida]PRA18452.1 hypothetical protein CQ002_04070 [Pseudomonas sp. MYb13]PRA24159.1 hypothetical protein CQ004_04090 [Pseudomonas lurida]PRA39242.1 hypothetical protein CQ005_04710 [Pseudomonas lurida]PRC03103.1 hypothetical protein CQ014_04090 [Pseudomonas lurida]
MSWARDECGRETAQNLCGGWLACDADAAAWQVHRGDAIAGKPAPTKSRACAKSHKTAVIL